LALIYALVQSQAQRGAYTGVVRTVALRTLLFAGQSALTEAAHAIRHPPPAGSGPLGAIEGGSTSGTALEPEATRAKYKGPIDAGLLTIGPVEFDVVSRPPSLPSEKPWLIDLTVRVSYTMAGVKLSRLLRRRCVGRGYVIREIMGPRRGQVVFTALSMYGGCLVEVMDR
jgi:hypothetical protein